MFLRSTFFSAVLALSSSLSLTHAASDGATGALSTLDGGLSGTVMVKDSKTLVIKDYKLEDAGAPALYWWGSTDDNLKSGFRISSGRVSDKSDGKDLEIPLDSGKSAADFTTVGLWCERFGINYGQATLKASSKSGGSDPSTTSDSSSTPSATAAKANAGNGRSELLPMNIAAAMAVAALMLGVGA